MPKGSNGHSSADIQATEATSGGRFSRHGVRLDDQRFLTGERVGQIAELIEPLIREDLTWVDRRKESIEILDDTALRRQISVDFSLRSPTRPLLAAEEGQDEALYCAPVFVLPKAPANLMAFDLEDEHGEALSLIGRADNARISAAAMIQMATGLLGDHDVQLPDDLRDELSCIAESESGVGQQIARRLLEGRTAWPDELAILRTHNRFMWWVTTLAHSSIVVALFRAERPGRKLLKLRFEEPIATKQRRSTSLGWDPYRVGIDSSLIEARRYHFEAQAPPGLRITRASLSDDNREEVVSDRGFLRRVHLYRPDAETAGAGTAVLWLRVSGQGFVGGAPLAAVLTTGALIGCFLNAGAIAKNPTTAPALLLVLPGLIATYIGRPDQHALTTRLLASARWLLLAAAGLAYLAAAKVALTGGAIHGATARLAERTNSLELWLGLLSVLSLIPLAGLGVMLFRARIGPGAFSRTTRFEHSHFVAAPRAWTLATLRDPSDLPSGGYELAEDDGDSQLIFVRSTWHGDWVLTLRIHDARRGDTSVACECEHVSRMKGLPLAPGVQRKELETTQKLIEAVQDQAITDP